MSAPQAVVNIEALAPDSDEALMLAYQRGDAQAFTTLYQRHRARLFTFLVRETGRPDVAEDLYQELWIKVVRSRERYTVQAKFTTWLFTVAHNCLMDFYRRSNRLAKHEETVDELPDAPSCERESPEALLENDIRAEHILRCLGTVPDIQREAFLLKEEGGLSLQEIAEVTGAGFETVKSRLRYAMKRLRDCLAGSLGQDYQAGGGMAS